MELSLEELAAPYLLNLVANALYEVTLTDAMPSITVELSGDAASFFRRNNLKHKFFRTFINDTVYEIYVDGQFETATIFDIALMGITSLEDEG